MEITLEMVDAVRERTGATYEDAKAALEKTGGNVVDAIILIERENGAAIDIDLGEKIREAVHKGNVNRIRVMRGDEELMNIPVSVGLAGGVLGVLAGPGVLISAAVVGAVAKFGFGCRFEIVKDDGTIESFCKECKTDCGTKASCDANTDCETNAACESNTASCVSGENETAE